MTTEDNSEYRYLKYELQIDDFINHHKYAYKYPGPEGSEFRVILSILHDMTARNEISSAFIRWYAAILNLMESHHRFLSEEPLFNPRQESPPRWAPPYLEILERLVTQTCRLGIILSAGKKIDPPYTGRKLEQILPLAEQLSRMIPTEDQPPEQHMPYIWTHVLLIQHLCHLLKMADTDTIQKLTDHMENNRGYVKMTGLTLLNGPADKCGLYQIENFWNGFIT